jgi:hypothetical protein
MPQQPVSLYVPASQTITASGVSADFDTSDVENALFSVFVAGATGTTPSMTVTLEVLDGAGNYITTAQLTAITSGPNYATLALGPGANGYIFTSRARVRWTVTGTTPSFTGVGISLIGR